MTVYLPDGQAFTAQTTADGVQFAPADASAYSGLCAAGWRVQLATAGAAYTAPTLTADALTLHADTDATQATQATAQLTRDAALMLYVSLHWYFAQAAPGPRLPDTDASRNTAEGGKPRGAWRVTVPAAGLLGVRGLAAAVAATGLVESAATSVLVDGTDGTVDLFVAQGSFWQLPASAFVPPLPDLEGAFTPGLHLGVAPPAPLRYTMTGTTRHPARPRPPQQGEVFYSRFVPSVGQYLTLRVASLADTPVAPAGPRGPKPAIPEAAELLALSDTQLLQRWFALPRVSAFWGQWEDGFLQAGLASKHSFPVIAAWDGVPFGYFELYWVKEDVLGTLVAPAAADYDRGLHVFIGEAWARGRVPQWLSTIAHYCFLADPRTASVCIEPRVDNTRFIALLEAGGFCKQREVTFPHKTSWFGRLTRDGWAGPAM